MTTPKLSTSSPASSPASSAGTPRPATPRPATPSPADRLIDTLLALEPLADLPRTGWLLRGVRPAESIAEHTFGVAVVVMLLVDELRARGHAVDGERALRMALVHDAPEAVTGDIPMPQKTADVGTAIDALEAELAASILGSETAALYHEAAAGETLEARIVKAADKIQMMVKVLAYEGKGWRSLGEFWNNAKNFEDRELELAREVFERIRARRGPH